MIESFQPDGDSRENVRVVVRVRPLSEKETKSQYNIACKVDDLNCSISVHKPSAPSGEPPKVFTFDSVFGCNSKQVQVFLLIFKEIFFIHVYVVLKWVLFK